MDHHWSIQQTMSLWGLWRGEAPSLVGTVWNWGTEGQTSEVFTGFCIQISKSLAPTLETSPDFIPEASLQLDCHLLV
jgi:hypothetical protein